MFYVDVQDEPFNKSKGIHCFEIESIIADPRVSGRRNLKKIGGNASCRGVFFQQRREHRRIVEKPLAALGMFGKLRSSYVIAIRMKWVMARLSSVTTSQPMTYAGIRPTRSMPIGIAIR